MLGIEQGELRRRAGMVTAGAVSFLALASVGSGGAEMWRPTPTVTALPSLGDGLVSGVFVAGAAYAAMVSWRRHGGPRTGRIVATGALVAAQSLVVTLVALQSTPPRGQVALALLVAVAVAGLVAVVGPLLRLDRTREVVDDGFAIGLGMGIVASGHLLLQFPMARPPATLMVVLISVLVATHVVAAALVLRQRVLSRPVALLVVAAVVVVAASMLVNAAGSGAPWDAAVAVARAAVGAAWLGVAWFSLRRTIEDDRSRIATFEQRLVATTRDQRERMHELRSTVAGLVCGSELLDRPDVEPEVRERLWSGLRRELDRMERLLSNEDAQAVDIDLDEALGLMLDLQRLKGRHVELRSSGDVVHARYDALAEVLNVLMDNAVKHGGADNSLVEVVARDDDNVDIRVTDFGRGIPAEKRPRIFDWGGRASTAPGEGIGLHVAQRLMTEDGGSLRLADEPAVGSQFVITLPRARRSPEDGAAPVRMPAAVATVAPAMAPALAPVTTPAMRTEDGRACRVSG